MRPQPRPCPPRLPLLATVLLSLALTNCSAAPPLASSLPLDAVRLATLNVHYLAVHDDRMRWDERRDSVEAALREADADLVAFQEMETFEGRSFSGRNVQLDFVLERFPEYEAAAVGDPRSYPGTQPILYRRDRFEPLEQGFFFFSPEPDEIYSRPWHARFPAFASWVRFRDERTGERFVVVNVHFDATSARNRLKSARLVVARTEALGAGGEPVIIAGDFNAPRFFPTMGILRRAGYERAPARGATFHFNRGLNVMPGIDHVLVSGGVEVLGAWVDREAYGERYPSDHYPVVADVRLRER